MHNRLMICVFAAFAIMSAASYADIGAIGSPVVPSNLPAASKPARADTKAMKSQAHDDAQSPPLMVINFNQRHVYYDRQLEQTLTRNETNQAGALYEVVSKIPSGTGSKTQVENINDTYAANLSDVVGKMEDAGVSSSRIQVSTVPSDDMSTQEISIFAK